ncbi:hydroxysteroid dehydrogenase-like protein 1 [Centruroides sculpturatus]|uniref:hydroxysteroid dehydrogenase-like protein 1 n=1 Tax=Centruroides sculpturatus TaxID=218467 RepID=UPI000C6E4423|nr:hydroxysteroid dehydrogenase-like protein 1 [Centruroides sculpturatus]
MNASECFLVSVGIIFVTSCTMRLLKEIFRMIQLYVSPSFLNHHPKRFGEWAVITGGSSGIGKHTAHELAKRGLKVMLISNELEELEATAKDIETKFGVECCYALANLTGGKEDYDNLWSKIEDKDVGIFVNCAGIAGRLPCDFLNETESNTLTMIALNVKTVISTTYRMTKMYAKKNKGIVINVSSASPIHPFPYLAIYSSCKKFIDIFTKAVNVEFVDKGIMLQSLLPFFVQTRMTNKLITKSVFVPLCEKFCKSWIKCIGKEQSYTGYWLHEILFYCISCYGYSPYTLLRYLLVRN